MELYDFQKKAFHIAIRVINHEAELYFYRKTPPGYALINTKRIDLNSTPKITDVCASGKTVLSLPIDFFHFRLIELPFSDRDKVLPTLPYTMDAMVLGKSGSYMYDYIITGKSETPGKRFKALCIYVEKQRLKNLIETLKALNITPCVITSATVDYVLKESGFQTPEMLTEPLDIDEGAMAKLLLTQFKSPAINFCRDEFKPATISGSSKRLLNLGVTLLLMSVLLALIYSSVKIQLINKRIKMVQSLMDGTYREMFKDEKKVVDPYAQLQGKVKQLQDTMEITDSVSPLDMLLITSHPPSGNVILTEVEMEGGRAVFRGEAESLASLNAYTEALRQEVSHVKLIESKQGIDSKVKFVISINNTGVSPK
ncbi:MAG: hypothetical protein H7844_12340 [Nitrospirae bacterium YQR-1]